MRAIWMQIAFRLVFSGSDLHFGRSVCSPQIVVFERKRSVGRKRLICTCK